MISHRRMGELGEGFLRYCFDANLKAEQYGGAAKWYFAGAAHALSLAGYEDEAEWCRSVANSPSPAHEFINSTKIAVNEMLAGVGPAKAPQKQAVDSEAGRA